MKLANINYGKHVDQLSTWELEELDKIFKKKYLREGQRISSLGEVGNLKR